MSVRYTPQAVELKNGKPIRIEASDPSGALEAGRNTTMAYRILQAHQKATGAQSSQDAQFHLGFDALISHDITYVGIIQTARASGLTRFPLHYALTNCHNSLCAVGGTINEDDHVFGLSAAHRYGGSYVPANVAVIHQYARERMVGVGRMILGSDSHTRYGSFGCMGFGEGGGELVKQLLSNSYDLSRPEVVLVWLTGTPRPGVGPHDVALALVRETFREGRAKNRILEFAGPGVADLSMDYRAGIDVMTTETGCLSSIWPADISVAAYYDMVGRPEDFEFLQARDGSCYDALVELRLDAVEPMIALPFHPSKAYAIAELQASPREILKKVEEEANAELDGSVALDLLRHVGTDGSILCDQGIIVGCAGGLYENLAEAARILQGGSVGNGYFNLSVFPASETINLSLTRDGTAATLMQAGAILKPAFCGPCFGAGDTPAKGALSIRHATRNFANREGAKPGLGQVAGVALMDARSIAATALNQGRLTAATELDWEAIARRKLPRWVETYEGTVFDKRCYRGFGHAEPDYELRFGPGIVDWPPMPALGDDLLLELAAVIHDAVTTTDELIPSGETSSYRSNPLALAEFTLSRRVPDYVERARHIRAKAEQLVEGNPTEDLACLLEKLGADAARTQLGSALFATKPGDGSAREQAASCQKVLGGAANIACEYATKRYRSNCINWGLLPFTLADSTPFDYEHGDFVYIPGIRAGILQGREEFAAQIISGGTITPLTLHCTGLTTTERQILASGCLINYYADGQR
ncbi:MAG: hydratase [Coriobacteriales bacterium]|jgi:aconitate hydratase|nr:hydratase [Coriobacteriales bacterium]